MMHEINRDILVLSNQSHLSQQELEQQVAQLSALLHYAESWDSFCTANEIIDINNRRIIQKPFLMQKAVHDKIRPEKAFVFVNNKN